ncbi:MAG: glycoside hydrolase family 1 protein [Ktedonobacterales bacterium]
MYAHERSRGVHDAPQILRFPEEFIWGVGSSSHQMEGNTTNNQWHAWEERGGILSGDRAGLACNWWNNAEEDFDRAREMGVNGMRISLEWSRLEPEDGRWDEAAFARYRQMLRGLQRRGIEPLVTLHHFTEPLWLAREGGFASAKSPLYFERYAAKCVEELGDLCDFWCTVNEPNVYVGLGYLLGLFPPGRKNALLTSMRVLSNLLRAHAGAYNAIHARQSHARVGLAHHICLFDPGQENAPLDKLLASVCDVATNDLVLDALTRGRFRGGLHLLSGDLSGVRDTFDYIGVNYYYRLMVGLNFYRQSQQETQAARATHALHAASTSLVGSAVEHPDDQMDAGSMGDLRVIYPDGIGRALRKVAGLGRPIYVTENGFADASDAKRPSALLRTLTALQQEIEQGLDVRGYYHWSLVDNFEWVDGWSINFGLIALDPLTQKRTLRPSAELYGRICRANALSPDILDQYMPARLIPVG